MIRNLPAVPVPESPAFTDIVIADLQNILKNGLSWLDYSFGQSQRLKSVANNMEHVFPGVHIRSGEYQNLLPDQNLGNFSFFTIDDPQEMREFAPKAFNLVTCGYGLVFWFDLNNIFEDKIDRQLEAVKAEILRILTSATLQNGRLTIEKIYSEAKNVYKDYSLKEVDSQYLMQPFGGLRFEGSLSFREKCI